MSGAPVSTDTRRLRRGDVFVALPGERYDGAAFVAEALARGASAVVARPEALEGVRAPDGVELRPVEDPRAALLDLAVKRRASLRGPVVGVTGSVGKTTTCALIAAALGAHGTEGGRNTYVGVAATLAGVPPGEDAAVVEVAMRRRGDVAEQTALVRPTAGVITRIGPAHIGLAGGIENIAAGKAELLAALPAGAPAVVPAGEPLLAPHRRDDLALVTHGHGGLVEARGLDGDRAVLRVGREEIRVRIRQPQPHNLLNLAAAVALLRALGREIPEAIEATLPPFRWQPDRLGPVELVLDCANSSPPGLAAALESFAAEPAERRIAVLGLMADLGAASERFHREAGAHARRLGYDDLIAVGEVARPYLDGFGGGHHVEDPAAARALLGELGRAGDRALVKGSYAAALWELVEAGA